MQPAVATVDVDLPAFEAGLPPEVLADLNAIPGIGPEGGAQSQAAPAPVTDAPEFLPTVPGGQAPQPVIAAAPQPVVAPAPAAPEPVVAPAPAVPQANPEVERLALENFHYKQMYQAQRDVYEVDQYVAGKAQALRVEGWEEEQIAPFTAALKQEVAADLSTLRERNLMQEGAFAAGRKYGMNMDQVKELATARDRSDFQGILQRHVTTAPSAREQELQTQLQMAASENEKLKRQVVPNGQRFGDLGGATPAATPSMDRATVSSLLDNGGFGISEDQGKAFDAAWASGTIFQ